MRIIIIENGKKVAWEGTEERPQKSLSCQKVKLLFQVEALLGHFLMLLSTDI